MNFFEIFSKSTPLIHAFNLKQISAACLAFYGLIAVVYTLTSKPSPPLVEEFGNLSDIPSIESPEFGKWLETPGNIERLVS